METKNAAEVLSVEEVQMVNLIDQIVFDTIEALASKNFIDSPNGEVVVTRKMLAAIMAPAAATAYEAGRTGVYVTTHPSLPKHLLN